MLFMNELKAIDKPKFKLKNLGNVKNSENGRHKKVATSHLLSLWGFPLCGNMLCNKRALFYFLDLENFISKDEFIEKYKKHCSFDKKDVCSLTISNHCYVLWIFEIKCHVLSLCVILRGFIFVDKHELLLCAFLAMIEFEDRWLVGAKSFDIGKSLFFQFARLHIKLWLHLLQKVIKDH